jgi:hyperpolarization activated cyclic nucleotide-gated potassium channel 2
MGTDLASKLDQILLVQQAQAAQFDRIEEQLGAHEKLRKQTWGQETYDGNMPGNTPPGGQVNTGSFRGIRTTDTDDTDAVKEEEQQRERDAMLLKKYASAELYGTVEQRHTKSATSAGAIAASHQHSPRQLLRIGLLHPSKGFRLYWDLTSILLVVYISIMLPLQLAFVQCAGFGLELFDVAIDIFFLVDIAINFRTAVEVEGFELLTGPREIARLYLRGWFALDVISSFPIDWVVAWSQGESPFMSLSPESTCSSTEDVSSLTQLSTLLKVLRVIKLLRLLRLARLFRMLDRWREAIGMSHNLQRLGKLMFIMLIFSHWDGCMLFLVASLEGMSNQSWVYRSDLLWKSGAEQYAWSFFSAVAQIFAISFGIADPKTMGELFSFLVSLVLGATLYGFFVAALTAVLAEGDAAGQDYRRKLDKIQQYMRHTKMDAALRARIRAYYELCFPTKRAFDENEILSELTHPLREAICRHKTGPVLATLHILESEVGLSTTLSRALERVVYVSGDEVIREGETSGGMYFIQAGKVNVCKQHSGTEPVTTLTAGAFFGEMALLTSNSRALATIVTATYMEGFLLSREAYLTIVAVYPQFQRYIETVAVLRLRKTAGKTGNIQARGGSRAQRGRSRSRVLLDSLESHSPQRKNTRQDRTANRLVKRLSVIPADVRGIEDREPAGTPGMLAAPRSLLPKCLAERLTSSCRTTDRSTCSRSTDRSTDVVSSFARHAGRPPTTASSLSIMGHYMDRALRPCAGRSPRVLASRSSNAPPNRRGTD